MAVLADWLMLIARGRRECWPRVESVRYGGNILCSALNINHRILQLIRCGACEVALGAVRRVLRTIRAAEI